MFPCLGTTRQGGMGRPALGREAVVLALRPSVTKPKATPALPFPNFPIAGAGS